MADPVRSPVSSPEMPAQLKREIAAAEALRTEMENAPPLDEGAPPAAAPGNDGVPPQPGDQGQQPPAEGDETADQRLQSMIGRLSG